MTYEEPPITISVQVAGRLLGMSVASVYRAIRSGDFPTPARKVNGRYIIATKPLLDFLGLDELPTDQYGKENQP